MEFGIPFGENREDSRMSSPFACVCVSTEAVEGTARVFTVNRWENGDKGRRLSIFSVSLPCFWLRLRPATFVVFEKKLNKENKNN